MDGIELQPFLDSLRTIPWFSNLGQPNERDNTVKRIRSWNEWLGPEGGYRDWFGRYSAMVREYLFSQHPDDLDYLESLANQIEKTLIEVAREHVKEFSDEEDAWHGPTACVWQAAYQAATIGCYVHKSMAIPENLRIEWYWFKSGHWPCDYAEPPHGYWDETVIYTQPCKYVVL